MATTIAQFVPAEVLTDFEFPQREAAFFYGLFLRGHDVDALRQDIDIPRGMMDKWMRARDLVRPTPQPPH